MSTLTEEMIAALEAEIKTLKEEEKFRKLLETGGSGRDLYEKMFQRARIQSEKAREKYTQSKKEAKLTPAIIGQYYTALGAEKEKILSIVESNAEFFSKFKSPKRDVTQNQPKKSARELGEEQLQKIRAAREMAEKKAIEEKEREIPLSPVSNSDVEALSQPGSNVEDLSQPEILSPPLSEPINLGSEEAIEAIEALKKEIKKFELTIKVRLSSYNPALEISPEAARENISKYTNLSKESRNQKAQIEHAPDQKAPIEFYEAYKNALEKELGEMDVIIARQQSNPNAAVIIQTNNDNILIRALKATGSWIGDSRVGRGFKAIGKGIVSGFKAIGRAYTKFREKATDQSLLPSSVDLTANPGLAETSSTALTKQASAVSGVMQEIHDTRASQSQSHDTSHGNLTLFSDALSPSEEPPPVNKAALELQRLKLKELTVDLDVLDYRFFNENFPELKDKLEKPEENFKEIKQNYWKERREYKKLIDDYVAGTGEEDLQKIYDAGLKYEKALEAVMAKEREYLKKYDASSTRKAEYQPP